MKNRKILKILVALLVFFGAMAGVISFKGGFNDLRVVEARDPSPPEEPRAIFTLEVRARRGNESLVVDITRTGGTTCPGNVRTTHICSVETGIHSGIIVTYRAPQVFDGSNFERWEGPCAAGTDRHICRYNSGGNRSGVITAFYAAGTTTTSNTLNIRSDPTGLFIEGIGTTNTRITENNPISRTLMAPLEHTTDRNMEFDRWDGCDSTSGNRCEVTVSGGTTKTVTAHYKQKAVAGEARVSVRGLLEDGRPFEGGIPITAGQVEFAGRTPYDISINEIIRMGFVAPREYQGAEFVRWTGCDTAPGESCTVVVRVDETREITVFYRVRENRLNVRSLVNGERPATGVGIQQRMPEPPAEIVTNREITSRTRRFLLEAPHKHPADANVSFTHWTGCDDDGIENSRLCSVGFIGRWAGGTRTVTARYANISLACHTRRSTEIVLSYRVPDNDFILLQEMDDGHIIPLTNLRGSDGRTYIDKGLQPDKEYKYHLMRGGNRFVAANAIASVTCRTLARGDNGANRGDSGRADDDAGNLLGIRFRSPLRHTSLMELFNYLVRLLFWLGLAGMSLVVIIGAFQMIFSGGDPSKFARGQKTIMYGAVGLVIILLSWAIVAIIRASLTPD